MNFVDIKYVQRFNLQLMNSHMILTNAETYQLQEKDLGFKKKPKLCGKKYLLNEASI